MKETKFRCVKTLKGHRNDVTFATFSPDEKRIVSSSWDKTIKIWDSNSGECLHTLKGHKRFISSVSFSPDGNRIISSSWDKTIKIWDLNSGMCLQTL
jgi:WD40 repeat protein